MFIDKKKSAPFIKAGALIIAILFAALYIIPLITSSSPGGENQSLTQEEVKFTQDVQRIEAILSTNPTDTAARISLGNTYFDWGSYLAFQRKETSEAVEKFNQAIVHYSKALEEKPDDPNVRTDMAVALYYTGRSDEAINELKKVMEKHPDHEPSFFNYAFMLERTGKKEEAVKAWEDFLKRFPQSKNLDAVKAHLSSLKNAPSGQ
jgi:tetratricopeptide (TPR) repeat protein